MPSLTEVQHDFLLSAKNTAASRNFVLTSQASLKVEALIRQGVQELSRQNLVGDAGALQLAEGGVRELILNMIIAAQTSTSAAASTSAVSVGSVAASATESVMLYDEA